MIRSKDGKITQKEVLARFEKSGHVASKSEVREADRFIKANLNRDIWYDDFDWWYRKGRKQAIKPRYNLTRWDMVIIYHPDKIAPEIPRFAKAKKKEIYVKPIYAIIEYKGGKAGLEKERKKYEEEILEIMNKDKTEAYELTLRNPTTIKDSTNRKEVEIVAKEKRKEDNPENW